MFRLSALRGLLGSKKPAPSDAPAAPPDTLLASELDAEDLLARGLLAEAETAYRQLVLSDAAAREPLRQGRLLISLAEVQRRLGKRDQVLATLHQARPLVEKEPLLAAQCLDVRAALHADAKEWRECLNAQREAWDRADAAKTTGLELQAARQARIAIAALYSSDGYAPVLADRALAALVAVHGEEHETLAHFLLARADFCQEHRQFSEAIGFLAQALRIRRRVHGPNSLEVIPDLCRLAQLSELAGQPGAAAEWYEQALTVHGLVVGARPQERVQILLPLASICISQDRLGPAIELLEQSSRILGVKSPTPVHVASWEMLALAYTLAARTSDAADAYENACRCVESLHQKGQWTDGERYIKLLELRADTLTALKLGYKAAEFLAKAQEIRAELDRR